MAVSLTFTPNIPTTRQEQKRKNIKTCFSPKCSSSLKQTFSDPFVVNLAETLEDSVSSSKATQPFIQKLRNNSSESLLTTPWPSRKHEPFRFTDLSLLRNSNLHPVPDTLLVTAPKLAAPFFVGRVSDLRDEAILKRVAETLVQFEFADIFWSVNGAGFRDMVVVYVPKECKVESPVEFRYAAVEGGEGFVPVLNPRVFVLVEEGGEVGIVEEFVNGVGDGKCYWMNSVLEVVVGEGGKVRHSYVQSHSRDAAHTKWTSVRQETSSSYELVEVSSGGKLSRHNLHVQQLGPDTTTELSTLHVSTREQTQDLHSRLVLDYPRGFTQQLHKCIVAHSQGQAVFDGNVKVNRYAQQTNAGQLSRSLLLAPRATVNLKPNLQIIANDVKCSHGAAISDLEDSQLFYFLARGVDLETARKALIVSFAKEVVDRLPHKHLRGKVDSLIKELLVPAQEGSTEQV